MKFKSTCLTWLGVYVALAAVIGFIVYRRLPVRNVAIGAALGGAFILWIGIAYLVGIRQKIREVFMIRRAAGGEPPADGARIAAIGRINTTSGASLLTSPLTRSPSVAYKYEIRSSSENDSLLYEGFALTPSAIQSGPRSIRLLAYPDLQIRKRHPSSADVAANAREYIRMTEFQQPKLTSIKKSIAEMMAVFTDDDGSIRVDRRYSSGDPDLRNATFIEQIVSPGDQVCATGRYSEQRGGLVPDPDVPMHSVILRQGEPGKFVGRAIGGVIGYLIGGLLFVSAAMAGLIAFLVGVPLEASEEMSPAMKPTRLEAKLERVLEKRVRQPLREAGKLSYETVAIILEPGEARGWLVRRGTEIPLERATAIRRGDQTTITLGEDSVVLTMDRKYQPVELRLAGMEIPRAIFADALDLQLSGDRTEGIRGRLMFLSDRDGDPWCRARFRARVEGGVVSSQ